MLDEVASRVTPQTHLTVPIPLFPFSLPLPLSALSGPQLTVASRRGYDLDVSMFERLASHPAYPIVQLSHQRRMRPDIADLIRLEVGGSHVTEVTASA